MISFRNVTKKFGKITALNDISFEIQKGEFVFLTGHSGAGKTTIIRLLLGEFLPSSGSIEVNDKKITKIHKNKIFLWRRQLGVIFQDYKLFDDKTVFENVAIPLEIQGIDKKNIKEKVEKILDLVGLKERKNLFPAQLAGGELQRVSLARAVVTAPEILLADEPTGNLDIDNAWNLLKLFKQINEKSGTTIIMTTHNQEIVNSLNKRTIYLKEGEIIKDSIKKNEKS